MPLQINSKYKIQHPSIGIMDVRIKAFYEPINSYSGEVIEVYGKKVKARAEEQAVVQFMNQGKSVNVFFKEENIITKL